ncbi:DUF3824 domain-containing protein [Salana multivorans]
MTTPSHPDPYGEPPQPGPYGVPDRPAPHQGPAGPALPPQPSPYGAPPGYGPSGYGPPGYRPASAPGPQYGQVPPGTPVYGAAPPLADSRPPSAGRATSEAFHLFGRSAGPLIGFTACWAGIAMLLSFVLTALLLAVGLPAVEPYDPWSAPQNMIAPTAVGAAILNAISSFVGAIMGLMLLRGALQLARLGYVRFVDLWVMPRTWWVYGLVLTGLGTLVLSVPSYNGALAALVLVLALVSLLLHVCFAFAGFALLDSPETPLAAFGTSLRLVAENLGQTLLYLLIALGLTIAGALACLVGLLVTVPIVVVGLARLYTAIRGDAVVAT